ncbi:hypothetical protein BKA82DRAFT_1000939 [Pisolithus tinctorius]|uniref:Uncharacterized protein n=1 Tax=Pisolithus tinctorius Marx 270 TaxID=870435 RepID=A0A0C3K3K7_PISTI|nr:hypothetical protein BKA82DRAFT_1000939 [Pisolithus tinctorius]KIO04127.1 hypothetical protein M404DRAFT_1000939 [Pisolithus tinctorius Marx 270]
MVFNTSDHEPEVIAEAFAAYQHINQRWECIGLSTLNTMTIPCIAVTGMCPTFYPVTRKPGDAVVAG